MVTASLEEHLGENLRSLVLNTAVESETECLPRPISPCARPLIAAVISYRDFLVGAGTAPSARLRCLSSAGRSVRRWLRASGLVSLGCCPRG